MMISKKLILSSLALCICALATSAQELPVGMMLPTYYNGGFAGEAGAPRVATFSHFYYHKYKSPTFGSLYWRYRGSCVSVDHFIKGLRTGVAVTAGHIAEDQNMITDYQKRSLSFGSITLSPKVSSKGKYTFAPFLDFYFGQARDTVAQDQHTAGR